MLRFVLLFINVYKCKIIIISDKFRAIADKNSYGNNVNLWKLSFTNKNDLGKHYKKLETWCEDMYKNLTQDEFEEVLKKFNLIFENKEQSVLKGENYTTGDFVLEMRDELDRLNENTKNLEILLEEAEVHVEKYRTESEIPIVLGSPKITSLNLKCKTKDCCVFKNVKILKANGENFTEFLANVVPLDEKLSSTVLEFEHVLLENDFSSTMVNGHPSETLIDLSSDAFVNTELLVNGTVFINKGLNVHSGLFHGFRPDEEHMFLLGRSQHIKEDVTVNNLRIKNFKISGNLNEEPIENLIKKPEMNLPKDYKELKVSNMFVEGLTDGVNLTKIYEDALKKSGNQVLEGDLSIGTLEANEVTVYSGEISNISISKIEEWLCQPSSLIEINPLLPKASNFRSFEPKAGPIDSENEKEADEYVIIVKGLLKAKDFSDETNSTSLLNIVNNSWNLSETAIDSNFCFSNIQVANLKTEFVNEIPVSSWVLGNSETTQRIYGKKTFLENVHVLKEVVAERINNLDLENLEGDVLWLNGDQIIKSNLKFNSIKCHEITTNFTNLGCNTFDKMNRLEIRNSIISDQLEMENLTLTGDIDSLSWETILEDSVYEKDFVSGTKTISGPVKVDNLNITGRINDLFFEEFVALTSADANKILLDRNVTLHKPLHVDELSFEGLLNDVLKPNFEQEWFLKDATQIITAPVTFENVHMKSGSNLMNETINNINLGKLFTKSIKINQDASLKHLFSLGRVRAKRIDVRGTFNGADFNVSIVRSQSQTPQVFSGDWFFTHELTVNGSLLVEGYLSGLNLTQLCNLNPSGKMNLIVGGSVILKQEPIILSTVNNVNLTEEATEIWMSDEKTVFKSPNLRFNEVEFENKTTLRGFYNNVNLTDLSKLYFSKSQNRVMSGDYEFENLVIKKWCRIHEATVKGTVNGIDLTQWAQNVLLQDEDQIIRENLRFEKFETFNLKTEKTINGLNLDKGVLRFDVEDAVVEGEKTFPAINVLNLTLPAGKTIQSVDMNAWRENSVKTTGNVIIKGDLELRNGIFNRAFKVYGKVNDLYFDSKHLLTTKGDQVVEGVKRFDYSDRPDSGMKIRFLEVFGNIDGTDFNTLIKNQAYADRTLRFKQTKTFERGLKTSFMEVDGLLHGVNVSGMCHDVLNPVDLNSQEEEFQSLLDQTKTLMRVAKDRPFFFDYFELIQTLKSNIKAMVPTLDTEDNYLLAVFTFNTMKFMNWNDYSESFVNTDEVLNLTNNITFVASEVSKNSSFLYIETSKSAKIFEPKLLKEIEGINTSCIASFELKSLDKCCIFIGEKWNSSRILCKSYLMNNDLQTYQFLDSKGSVQVSVLTIEDETFIAAINKEVVVDKIENTLSIYKFDPKLQHFYVSHTLAEINPVALSSVSYKNNHYLVSAGGHLPESVHNSVLSIFRFNKRLQVFVRAQSIQVDTPVDVHFSILPSSQLALYVLTSNPTKPFVMFLHKGITGFVEETSGLSLYPGSQLYSYTDSRNQHFVIITGFGRGQILKAGFKGEMIV